MSYSSKVLYAGTGSQTDFTITFPFISISHVDVYVNGVLMLEPLHYTTSGTTVSFLSAPEVDDAIWIRRNTSPTSLLVDFHDGSVLNEADLDMQYQHNFYLYQEAIDSFNELINNALISVATGAGIVETETDEILAAMVNEMLNLEAADTIQQRVSDIDSNAEAILTSNESLQVQINALAGQTASAVYIQPTEPVPGVGGIPDPIVDGSRWYDSDDNNKAYIYASSAWVDVTDPRIGVNETNITTLFATTVTNAAAVVTEQTARINADAVIASDLALVGAANGSSTAFVIDTTTVKIDLDSGDTFATRFTDLAAADAANSASISTINTVSIPGIESDVTALEARYGVTLNVNGYITGFLQNNDGSSGNFIILADKFAIVDPTGDPAETEFIPFGVSGGVVSMQNVEINGNLMVAGTINGTSLINGTVGSTQIGANAITTTQLNASAVTAAKIAAGTITADKISVTSLDALTGNMGSLNVDSSLTIGSTGYVLGGQTDYHTGTGFFLGYDTDAYKFSIGDGGTSDFMTWDGSELIVRGNISIGTYTASTTEVLLDAPTLRSTNTEGSFTEIKKFEINKPGTVRLYWTRDCSNLAGGFVSNSEIKVYLDGVQQGSTDAFFTTTPSTASQSITTTETSQYITVEYKSGSRNPTEPVACGCNIWDVEVRAVIGLGEAVITD